MSVASQVESSIRKLVAGSYEDSLVSASVAMGATARREHPTAGDKDACRTFLQDYLPIICKVGWIAFGVSVPINFRYRRLDPKKPGIAVRSMPEMLYDVLRCTAVHEAVLPSNVRFTDAPVIQTGNDGELVLPADLIYGLLVAVIASPKNSGERISSDPVLSFNQKSIRVNQLWGRREEVEVFVGLRPPSGG